MVGAENQAATAAEQIANGKMSETVKPLAGIRILDLTHMLSGPYGSMILADLGAETIKVEPLQGEGTRRLLAKDPRNSLDGMGAYYITLNRNKKSIALNLKSAEGLEVFYDLVRQADVVISNFGAGVPERLRIDYASLSEINPRIITCTVPDSDRTAPNRTARLSIRLPRPRAAECRSPGPTPSILSVPAFPSVTWAEACSP